VAGRDEEMNLQPTKQRTAELDAQREAIYKEQDERMKTGKRKPNKVEDRILNILPSKRPDKSWTFANAEAAGKISEGRRIPPAVDLRQGRMWWKVQDQGFTGACVGYSVAYGLLWYKHPDFMPSARFAWMGSKETDAYTRYPTSFCEMSGTYIEGALGFAKKYGSIPDKMLSMKAETTTIAEEKIYAEAAKNRIESYHRLNGPDEWRKWIAERGPVIVQLQPDPAFYGAKGRVLKDYERQGLRSGAHAVCLVGYGPDLFIVRNSWGKRWGSKGYCYVSEKYAEAAFTESFGIV
tara:strand:+ start:428 stop:1306 length:879 start_codon:yes stop_codon:yes gene_type:complete